jgi:hypothetical protein
MWAGYRVSTSLYQLSDATEHVSDGGGVGQPVRCAAGGGAHMNGRAFSGTAANISSSVLSSPMAMIRAGSLTVRGMCSTTRRPDLDDLAALQLDDLAALQDGSRLVLERVGEEAELARVPLAADRIRRAIVPRDRDTLLLDERTGCASGELVEKRSNTVTPRICRHPNWLPTTYAATPSAVLGPEHDADPAEPLVEIIAPAATHNMHLNAGRDCLQQLEERWVRFRQIGHVRERHQCAIVIEEKDGIRDFDPTLPHARLRG